MIVRFLKIFFALLALCIFLVFGLILHLMLFSFFRKQRLRIISFWNKALCIAFTRICSLDVILQEKSNYFGSKGVFIVSNHLSYLDGVVLGSIFPVIYISKLQVKSWPLIGWMCMVAGTIFIDRKHKSKSADSVREIASRLKAGANILLFPEGTSTDGDSLRSFQSAFFAAPLMAQAQVLPVTIRYIEVNSREINRDNRDKINWYGQIPFFTHIWHLLGLKKIKVIVRVLERLKLDSIPNNSSAARKRLSERAHSLLTRNLQHFLT